MIILRMMLGITYLAQNCYLIYYYHNDFDDCKETCLNEVCRVELTR